MIKKSSLACHPARDHPWCPKIKMSITIRRAVLFLAILLPLSAAPITLDQVLELADQNHPQLQAGAAQIEAARAGVMTASAYPNPEVGVRAGGQDYRVPGNVRGFVSSYNFVQPLELGPLRPARIE